MNQQVARRSVLDIEASGISCTSYPIEIGIALEDGSMYQALLKPMEGWHHWDKEAESIHGLSRTNLVCNGRSVIDVCNEMNAFCEGHTVFSDCWVLDSTWLNLMFARAGIEKQFSCKPIEAILEDSQRSLYPVCKVLVEAYLNERKHRALDDAKSIQLAMFLLENGSASLDDPSALSIANWCHQYFNETTSPYWCEEPYTEFLKLTA